MGNLINTSPGTQQSTGTLFAWKKSGAGLFNDGTIDKMATGKFTKEPVVEVQMLIRKPAAIVYQAFVDPAVTTNFWFTKSSGMLEKGTTVIWEWEMYAASVKVTVQEMLRDEKIIITWGTPPTTVEFHFQASNKQATYVIIRNYGFIQEGDELIRAINDSTGGFTTVIDGLKAYLEHGIRLNLIADKFPGKATL